MEDEENKTHAAVKQASELFNSRNYKEGIKLLEDFSPAIQMEIDERSSWKRKRAGSFNDRKVSKKNRSEEEGGKEEVNAKEKEGEQEKKQIEGVNNGILAWNVLGQFQQFMGMDEACDSWWKAVENYEANKDKGGTF